MKGSFIKMKKLIALLLAVSSLAMSTSALAFNVSPVADGNGASRNYLTGGSNANGADAFVEGKNTGVANLPTYRKGDEITLEISGSEVVEGATLTFICSKQADNDYNNYNVQMIDQITLDSSSTATCTYKLRESLEDGLYKLEMRLGGVTKTYSFLIGTPSVELLYVNNVVGQTPAKADKYLLKDGDAHCFAKAIVSGGANFSQTGTEFGFIFSNGTKTSTYTKGTNLVAGTEDAQAVADSSIANNNSEIGGEAQYFFKMVIEGVNSVDQLPDVDVYLND